MSINPNQAPGYMPPAAPPQAPPVYQSAYAPPPSGGMGMKIPILFGAVIALLAANVYLFFQVTHLRDDFAKYRDSIAGELDKVRESSTLTTQSNLRKVEELRAQLAAARRQASAAAGEAKTEALQKVAETEAKLQAAQEKAQEQTNSKIADVKQATDSANSKISEVGNEVGNVKTDVATTKSQLEKTIADLKRTAGDVNGQGVLIATNGKELAALRELGERNYVEFDIKKQKTPQKVGDIGVLLKNADPKKHRYTIALTADDQTVEKKDRTINEPLQFLTSKAKQPYELVVNCVKKDEFVGYLSVPKVLNGRN
jgi:chromosome segregation ATPase